MSGPAPKSIRGWCFLCQTWHPGEQLTPEQVYPWHVQEITVRLDHLWKAYQADYLDRKRASELGFNLVLSTLVTRGIDPDAEEKVWIFDIIAWVREVYKEDERELKEKPHHDREEITTAEEDPTVDGRTDGGDQASEQRRVPNDVGGDG